MYSCLSTKWHNGAIILRIGPFCIKYVASNKPLLEIPQRHIFLKTFLLKIERKYQQKRLLFRKAIKLLVFRVRNEQLCKYRIEVVCVYFPLRGARIVVVTVAF